MALTARQRAALPPSAFLHSKARRYPIPTRAQARRAGISEAQRIATHRAALSYAARRDTAGNYAAVARLVRARAGGKVASVRRR